MAEKIIVLGSAKTTPVARNASTIINYKTAKLAKYKIVIRSFHPDVKFEALGMYFKGDHRGFTLKPSDEKTTSRIYQIIEVDTDDALNPAKELQTKSDHSRHYLQKNDEHYDEELFQPKAFVTTTHANVATFNSEIDFMGGYSGENYAMPYAKEFKKWFYSADRAEIERRKKYGIPINRQPAGVSYVPSLDVRAYFRIVVNSIDSFVDVSTKVLGDAFPNCEVFILDEKDSAIFLGVFVRQGYPMTALPLENYRPMIASQIRIKINVDGSFANELIDLPRNALHKVDSWNSWYELYDPDTGRNKPPNDYMDKGFYYLNNALETMFPAPRCAYQSACSKEVAINRKERFFEWMK